MSDDLEYTAVEVTSRTLTLHGLALDADEAKAANKGECVRVPERKAKTLEARGKVSCCTDNTARNALESDDFQAMRKAASSLGLDVGSTPDKDTLREALEAAL